MPAELADGRLKGDPGAEGAPEEEETDRSPVQARLGALTPDLAGEVQDGVDLGLLKICQPYKVSQCRC